MNLLCREQVYLIHLKLILSLSLPLHLRNGLGAAKEGEPQYVVVHCTGYIKSWPPAGKTSHFESLDTQPSIIYASLYEEDLSEMLTIMELDR